MDILHEIVNHFRCSFGYSVFACISCHYRCPVPPVTGFQFFGTHHIFCIILYDFRDFHRSHETLIEADQIKQSHPCLIFLQAVVNLGQTQTVGIEVRIIAASRVRAAVIPENKKLLFMAYVAIFQVIHEKKQRTFISHVRALCFVEIRVAVSVNTDRFSCILHVPLILRILNQLGDIGDFHPFPAVLRAAAECDYDIETFFVGKRLISFDHLIQIG